MTVQQLLRQCQQQRNPALLNALKILGNAEIGGNVPQITRRQETAQKLMIVVLFIRHHQQPLNPAHTYPLAMKTLGNVVHGVNVRVVDYKVGNA